ncbi:UDP-galactopyranose mutase [Roseovarius sp. 2305UL8-3]|uniref:UDP-galactopyranose mutase n=1 Tax=Roseovarius conchicola TaxID=3121636 RepID=UPI0035297276
MTDAPALHGARHILIVGAGFAGAVYGRTLAEAGWRVEIIDRRDHVAGNAHDAVDGNGVRVHTYGPHLFHTQNKEVFDWICRFGAMTPYRHSVTARLEDGRHVPLPINRATLETLFDVTLPDAAAVEALLAAQAVPIKAPANAGEYLQSRIGPQLTDLFFRPYTRKMWGLELEDMDASVVRRIPLRDDYTSDYFPNDTYQAVPQDGYTALFANILDHPNISISLSTDFDRDMQRDAHWCFNAMAIDDYFDRCFGALPYRSIRFHTEARPRADLTGTSVVNYTDDGPLTRETRWALLPGHEVDPGPQTTVTVEEPCSYEDNGYERYYPVKTADGRYQEVYRRYADEAERHDRLSFIGRCGTYQYLDMHQVINQSLMQCQKWIASQT